MRSMTIVRFTGVIPLVNSDVNYQNLAMFGAKFAYAINSYLESMNGRYPVRCLPHPKQFHHRLGRNSNGIE